MRLATALVVLACAGLWAAPSAAAQGFDAGLRRASLGPRGTLLSPGAETLAAAEVAFALDLDFIERPLLLRDAAVGTEREVVGARTTATLLLAFGLGRALQLTLAVPAVFQEGEGAFAATGLEQDRLPAGAAGDARADFHYGLLPPRGASSEIAIALTSGLSAPTGDARAFAGAASAEGRLGAVGEARLGALRLALDLSLRLRESGELGGRRIGSAVVATGLAGASLFDDRLGLMAGLELHGALASGASSPGLFLVEARVAPFAGEGLELAGGVGAGLGAAPSAPQLELVLVLRHVPR